MAPYFLKPCRKRCYCWNCLFRFFPLLLQSWS